MRGATPPLTAALLIEEPSAHAAYLIDVVPEPPSPAHIYFVPTPPVLVVGPEGPHSDWFPEKTLLHEAVRGQRAPDRAAPSQRSGARREH